MAKKPKIDDFKDRWDSPMVSNLKLPKKSTGKAKTTSKKTTKRTK